MSMLDALSMFDAIAKGPAPTIDRTELKGFIVSTVDSYDCGPETAIIDKRNVYVVERYSTVQEAEKGHAKWIQFIKKGNRTIADIGYGKSIGLTKHKLVPKNQSKKKQTNKRKKV